jgi:hypothetical protein
MTAGNLNKDQHSTNSADDQQVDYGQSFGGKFLKYIDSVLDVFHRLPEVHDEVLGEIVESRLSKLRSLSEIDEATLKHIEPIVAENTKFLYSREWSISWAKAQMTKPILENFLMVVGFIILPSLALIVAISGHHLHVGNGPTFLASLSALVVFSIVIWLIARLLRFVTRQRGLGLRKIFIAAALVWMTVFSATNKSRISDLTRQDTHYVPTGIRHDYTQILWATAIHNALWIVACILVLRALSVFFDIFVRSLVLDRVTKSSSAVLYSAAVQDSLLDLVSALDGCVRAREAGKIVSISNETRTYVIDKIAEIASTIEGPWVRSLRTGYRSTDEQTARVGRKLAHSLRIWQSHAVFGGQHFKTIRDDCISFYVNALDGNWDITGVDDEGFGSLRVARYKAILRRLVAMILPVLLTFGIIRIVPTSMDGYKPYLILASILLAFVEIIALIDPDIVERINTVVNITNSIRRTPKS